MRTRLVVLFAAAIGACALADASSPAQAWCHYNNYGPCSGRAQFSYGYSYGYGYQYAQPYYQQQYYQQPYYQAQYYQPQYYPQPSYHHRHHYQQPAYYQPQVSYQYPVYAAPCCEPNWWEKLWGARNCCQQGYAQAGYAIEANSWNTNSPLPWSSGDVQINNRGNVYVMRGGVSVSEGFGPSYAYAQPVAPEAETYIQPVPRYYRKRVYRPHYRYGGRRYYSSRYYSSRPRVVVHTVYRNRPVYVRPRQRPHVMSPGNPSTSAGTYEVAPKKVLRP
jgi:hypothetical protein